MPLTPADVRNKQFSTTKLKPGYDEEEVDAFLDEAEVELDRLIQHNEDLRAKLAETLCGNKAPMSALHSPLADPGLEVAAAFTAGSFIVPFMRAFASKAGEDAYEGLKSLLGRLVRSRDKDQPTRDVARDSSIIRDEATGTTLVAPTPMPEDAVRELTNLDPALITGKTIVWMASARKWLIG
jgi:DivIVA domain-containing protein